MRSEFNEVGEIVVTGEDEYGSFTFAVARADPAGRVAFCETSSAGQLWSLPRENAARLGLALLAAAGVHAPPHGTT